MELRRGAGTLVNFALLLALQLPALRDLFRPMPSTAWPVGVLALFLVVNHLLVLGGAISVRNRSFGFGPTLAFVALVFGAIALTLLTFALLGSM